MGAAGKSQICGQYRKLLIYVLDGGALLHKIEWDRGDKFGEILDQYVKHIKINYVKSTTEDVTQWYLILMIAILPQKIILTFEGREDMKVPLWR